jgi:glycosyltransferase involved in cell wall biosynthesis/peptidoglycan/xylan/chitin deacetylase (PgdA/CDA1 family)
MVVNDAGPGILLSLFYLVKPLIPRRLQIYMRRSRCRRILASEDVPWPIDPTARRAPESWPGWPDGKKFALVLTHDVEGPKGVSRIRTVMNMESSRGFRSSFNLVGRDYEVPDDLLRDLRTGGFEIGIHGLHHNSLMYAFRKIFRRHAAGIRERMRAWSAVGFRSPAMHRRLNWLHELGIRYDSSTFDTDPLEPQPDGVGTIFPFWMIDQTSNKAYVELPYTLPQDFTLFVVLQEKTNEIWKRKLDWIATHGGMALVIVHPDYLSVDNRSTNYLEYPGEHYVDLLNYVRDRYAGQYWAALPSTVADYFASIYPMERELERRAAEALRRPLRVCMPTYSFYRDDSRVRRCAEALVQRGDHVQVLSLGGRGLKKRMILNGVDILRLQHRTYKEKWPLTYLLKTTFFQVRAAFWISLQQLRHRYDLVHAHNVPDSMVFSAILPRLMGAKTILDIHDVVPELFSSKFGGNHETLVFRAICAMEKLSTRFADHVIVSNDLWHEKLTGRSVDAKKCSVLINYPDPAIFHPNSSPQRVSNKKQVVYPGSLNFHQGLDIAVAAFADVARQVPEAEFQIYGVGPAWDDLQRQIKQLHLNDRVLLRKPLPLDQIAAIMGAATCGVVPKRAEGFGNEAFSTKILEFMALGVPVVVSRTAVDQYYFDDSLVLFFESGNSKDLADKMIRLLQDHELREKLVANGLEFIKTNCWDVKKSIYLDLVDRLTASNCENAGIQASGGGE